MVPRAFAEVNQSCKVGNEADVQQRPKKVRIFGQSPCPLNLSLSSKYRPSKKPPICLRLFSRQPRAPTRSPPHTQRRSHKAELSYCIYGSRGSVSRAITRKKRFRSDRQSEKGIREITAIIEPAWLSFMRSLPNREEQESHQDYSPCVVAEAKKKHVGRVRASMIYALEEDTRLRGCEDCFAVRDDDKACVVTIPVRYCVIFHGDLVHKGLPLKLEESNATRQRCRY
ncbi:hypothetical protein GQ600_24469 [Phytophthora cactorum]|nr:hypothetical protein GQ600_24469 [Phytophthora cactorum]